MRSQLANALALSGARAVDAAGGAPWRHFGRQDRCQRAGGAERHAGHDPGQARHDRPARPVREPARSQVGVSRHQLDGVDHRAAAGRQLHHGLPHEGLSRASPPARASSPPASTCISRSVAMSTGSSRSRSRSPTRRRCSARRTIPAASIRNRARRPTTASISSPRSRCSTASSGSLSSTTSAGTTPRCAP